MPLPSDENKRAEFWDKVTLGDAQARAYLEAIARLVYLADDSVDEELDFATRQNYMTQILFITMFELPMNPFYQRYCAIFAPMLAEVIVSWQKSDEWKLTGDLKRKIFGFVRRENIDSIAVAVAAIVGGKDHAAEVTELIMDTNHTSGETFEDWASEGKP